MRVAPITAPGEIERLDPPAPPEHSGASTGRATLRLLGWEGVLNQPLEEHDGDHAHQQER